MNKNIIIAFTRNTNKKSAQIFCRNFRHCCVLLPSSKKYILVQIGIDGVRLIPVGAREMNAMKKNGWVFVGANNYLPQSMAKKLSPLQLLTCVGFAKRALGIRNPFILTPDQLYKKIKGANLHP
ncbi:MAG: hypothetical protein FWF34_01145 [Alphaproteobacteria bacterium]|nr:hypothetical protein [Alphaproteobacteria bacterium]MCL2889847.1 hypothetical protein [Alphaproteobacteria bacterium]